MTKVTLIAGVGLILLGLAEVISTIPVGVCKPTVSGSCPTDSSYFEIGIMLVVLGAISLFLSKFEHSTPENEQSIDSSKSVIEN